LTEWRTPPGLLPSKEFDSSMLERWVDEVTRQTSESGHLEIAMSMLGHVLTHVPPDPDGLWIDRGAAGVLDVPGADELRNGFRTAIRNARGAHFVDPTGADERELAAKAREQADAVDEAGFPRLAATVRQIADAYDREATDVSRRSEADGR
jgi:hypothetical protein